MQKNETINFQESPFVIRKKCYMKSRLLISFILFLIPLLAHNVSAKNYGITNGRVMRPSGPNVNEIINKTIESRNGIGSWKRIRQISFKESYQTKNSNGKLLQTGRMNKQIFKQDNLFYSRSDDASVSLPALTRTLGPDGVWIKRASTVINHALMNKAYLFESSRDYLLLAMPYLLKKRNTDKVYQGTKPVHGKRCHLIYVTEIRDLKEFEGYEFLVSIDANTYCIKAISFWKETSTDKKTTVFLSTYKKHNTGHTKEHIFPSHFFIIFPDNSTLSINHISLSTNKSRDISRFKMPDNVNATYPHKKKREENFDSQEMLVRYYPRTTFLVSPEKTHYYLGTVHK